MLFWVLVSLFFLFSFVVLFGSPYVPTLRRDARKLFQEIYPISNEDVFVDLGSGDGFLLRLAKNNGARAYGIELNPLLVLITKLLSHRSANVTVNLGTIESYRLPDDVTIVYWFGNTRNVQSICDYLQRETKRIGHTFSVVSYGVELSPLLHRMSKGSFHLYKTALQAPKP